jgi:hypothetical protein
LRRRFGGDTGRNAGATCSEGRALGLEALEAIEAAVEGTLGGIHAGLEADELVAGVAEDVAEGSGLIEVGRVGQFVLDELGFEDTETAHEADGVNDAVEGVALIGGDGLVVFVILGAEGFEGRGIFTGEQDGLGVDAGLEGVEAGAGLALGGARAGGALGVEAVGLDLLVGCHGVDLSSKKKPLG